MPIQSPRPPVNFPTIDILTWIFDDETYQYDRSIPLFVSALDPSRYLTGNGLRDVTMKIGHGLRELVGVKPGDVALCSSPNHLLYPAVVFGTICAGAIFSGADPTYTAFELSRQLQDCGAKVIFASAATLSVVRTCAAELSVPRSHIFLIDGPKDGIRGIEDLLNFEGKDWQRLTTFREVVTTSGVLTYSSGTTGFPKGCEMTHWNMVSHSVSFIHSSYQKSARESRPEQPYIEPVVLTHISLFRGLGIYLYMINSARLGHLTYIFEPPSLRDVLNAIPRFQINHLLITPSIAVLLVKSPFVKNFNLVSVKQVVCIGAPLGSEVALAVEQVLDPDGSKNLKLCQSWGLTEFGIAAAFDHGDWDDQTGRLAVGPLLASVEAKIVDEEGSEVVQGKHGEIWLRAPFVFKGYWKNENATRETITLDGWFKTGDIGKTDHRGFFYITDRKKLNFHLLGVPVAPAELEAILLSHPHVADAGVIGVPGNANDNYGGEDPRAYIVKSNPELTAASIHAWMARHLTHYKHLTGGIEFVDVVPKNGMGKVVRRNLRDRAAESRTELTLMSRI
ncbi:acetyl-CoA synthetase-like protein [Sistotremastrum niveocremeum HHB9708]|uniref:Acetyl-CoA synthetase-like protein n=1 Tax=Sistotremastrum niveocremeum HHB9708 TaxID=1314777 RepID=A0A164W7T9_9AGAM|nr:acetyl-CoA synthetase-like protein [Sistotremastrum niveocremeum HHB9708]